MYMYIVGTPSNIVARWVSMLASISPRIEARMQHERQPVHDARR